jgi:hypothetical protein
VAVTAVAIAAAVVSYRTGARLRCATAWSDSVRVALLLLVLACLFRPVLVVRAAVPQQNVVGVLLDDSRSMQIADMDGQPRASRSVGLRARSTAALEGPGRPVHGARVPVLVHRHPGHTRA